MQAEKVLFLEGWGGVEGTYVLHLAGWVRERKRMKKGETKHWTLAVFDLSECTLSSGISQPWSWRWFKLHLGRCWITVMWSVSGMCLWYNAYCTGCDQWWRWVTKGNFGPGLRLETIQTQIGHDNQRDLKLLHIRFQQHVCSGFDNKQNISVKCLTMNSHLSLLKWVPLESHIYLQDFFAKR